MTDPNDRTTRRPKGPTFIVITVFVVLILVFGINAFVRGTGEAVGVTEAAPGGSNNDPPPESINKNEN